MTPTIRKPLFVVVNAKGQFLMAAACGWTANILNAAQFGSEKEAKAHRQVGEEVRQIL